MLAVQLSQISIYPVKSTAGLSLSTAWVEKQGLMFDRRFMVALADGSMVTARKYPSMVAIRSALTADGLIFTAPGREPLTLRYSTFKRQVAQAQVWDDNFTAYTTTDEADDWFSAVLGQRVELLFTGEQSNRVREKVGSNVSFADGYPLLLISQASLDELNRRSPEQHSMAQFRTNLVVSGGEPFIEDSWKRIKIGQVEFELVKPCERCVLTTVDMSTGQFRPSTEPLRTLAQFRANQRGGVFFGQNLIAKNEGMISVNDPIEVLEYKEKEHYLDQGQRHYQMRCVERETIANNFVTFWLEPQRSDFSEYFPGQHLPIEVIIDGKVHHRRYTLSSSPSRPERLAISVKAIDGGQVSHWLLEHLQVGDSLVAQSVEGNFHLRDEHLSQPLLLLSAGSGITPMLSMLRYLADHQSIRDVVFYHQCRSEADIPARDELEALHRDHPGLTLMLSLTQPSIDWFALKGRLSLSHLKKIENVTQRQVFVCGPDGFMQKAKNLLLKLGVPETAYHQEVFTVTPSVNRAYQPLTITLNGKAFQGDNQTTLLEQIERAGLKVANSCRAGFCGACKVTVQSGRVEQPETLALPDHERHLGKVLACCSIPETDIEVVSS
ncbi:hybrid-cluster NAD(P)-dependent oxidoreductase [Vibrio sp. 11986-1-5]|uniref:hybrid-cluster NAD(P)-dependent oxidoreductase n=1 Tax=Vibrio sp. 11986-1-5 TaxID=2211215 RepID=UPI000D72F4F1|nr:hybrid-cluster NAD(P)-dependent oxidoreductase [Vibrio sp. 11986-1-5]PXA73048.1 flavodoxin [Vibrio sp. 11986-1-5]